MIPHKHSEYLAVLVMVLAISQVPAPTRCEPVVELITFGPGDAIWMRFGHVGVRVHDGESGRDVVYNYGYAPFGRPDFIWGFVRGTSRFMLAVRTWENAVERYSRYDRTILSQRLNLSTEQALRVREFLEWNARPENREYQYDHLRDNCSTRVRDLLDEMTSGALRTAVGSMPRREANTYRDYTLEAARGHLPALVAMDLLGGPNQERTVGRWDLMYLPFFLQEVVSLATNPIGDRRVPLADPPVVVYQRVGPPPQHGSPYTGRILVLLVGLVLGLLFALAGRVTRPRVELSIPRLLLGRIAGLVLLPLGFTFGLIGAVLTLLIVVTSVPDFSWNENVLVFSLLDFGWCATAVRWLARGRCSAGRVFRLYANLRLAVLGGLVVAKMAGLLIQDNWAFIGCALLVLLGLRLGPASEKTTAVAVRVEEESESVSVP